MMIITRKEYLERSNAAFRRDIEATTQDVHEQYYAQFVTEKTKRHVTMCVSVDKLTVALRDRVVVAHIAHDRQRLTAGLADPLGGGVDGALELGMGRIGLRQQRDVRAVARGAKRDREADAAAAA